MMIILAFGLLPGLVAFLAIVHVGIEWTRYSPNDEHTMWTRPRHFGRRATDAA